MFVHFFPTTWKNIIGTRTRKEAFGLQKGSLFFEWTILYYYEHAIMKSVFV